MSAGRTQLSGIGQQDMYLTGNPQITHFKAVYRRHTNFAVETYKLTFNTNPTEVDNTIEAFISKNGDLLTGMWLEATLKQDKTTPTTYDYINWCNNTGAAYIEECKFYIGPHKIDHYTSTFSDIHNELTDHNQYEHMGLNKHMAKKGYLKSNSNSLNNLLLNIPLKFWFCRNNGLALPLCALKFSEVKVEIKLRSLKKLINHSSNAGGDITMTAPNNNVVLYANYVHLDDEEKKRFTTQPLEYLIEQVQFQENKVLESNVKYILTSNCITDDEHVNKDIVTGDYRALNLMLAPFNFPTEVLWEVDDYVYPHPPIKICLWSRDQIVDAMSEIRKKYK